MRRSLLPAMLALAAVLPMAATAEAKPQRQAHRAPKRVDADLALHVSRHNVLAGSDLLVSGRLSPSPGGAHRVKVVVEGPSGGRLRATTDRRGVFRAHWGLHSTGIYEIRAYGIHDRRVSGSESVVRRVTVYRPAAASYYGPGFYGGALACGGTLQPGTLGVAHKWLPCGTKVRLRYHGRSVTVPVVDRGPYVGGRDFDLTEATKERLRFPDVGVVLSSR
jgi:peptidoglycan lytic transglycosylase